MSIIYCNSIKNINKRRILSNVDKNGFVILRGLFSKKDLRKSLSLLKLNLKLMTINFRHKDLLLKFLTTFKNYV